MEQMIKTTGCCLCGAVCYEISGTMRRVVYCHCAQCRKTSGHFVAVTAVGPEQIKFKNDSGLTWYKSSDTADRGFCNTCGSSLFWRPTHDKYIALMVGALDVPTGLTSREHIFVADASDYYEITDGLPQFEHDHADLWADD